MGCARDRPWGRVHGMYPPAPAMEQPKRAGSPLASLASLKRVSKPPERLIDGKPGPQHLTNLQLLGPNPSAEQLAVLQRQAAARTATVAEGDTRRAGAHVRRIAASRPWAGGARR